MLTVRVFSLWRHILLVLLLFVFTMSISVPVSATHTLTISSSGAQSIDVIPSGTNTASIGEDQITVSTTCRSGYNMTISTSVTSNNLYLNGDSSNSASGTYITPADGTTTLANSTNAWGYYYNASTAPTLSSVFSPIPRSNQTAATVISPRSTPASADITDNFSLYYGVSVSSSLAPGAYKMIPDTNNSNNPGTIVYNLTLAQNCIPYTVNFNPTSTSTGSSVSGTGTMTPQEIYQGESTALSTMSFTPPSGYEFKEWNTAQDGSGTSYQDEELVTDLAAPAGSITLYAIWYQPPYLYNEVANRVKTINGSPQTQSLSDMQAVITEPTSSDPSTDTSNSGIFLYDANTFGTASDASNDYPIYYYRGILDSNLSDNYNTYGSTGNSAYYPNYVKLDNGTCWRIVRTTGSGGVKMIYNGLYGATTSGSCANSGRSTTNIKTLFSSGYTNKKFVGYTYDSTVADSSSYQSTDIVFGSNSNYSTANTTDSVIKDYIENTWYANNMTDYTSMLESSAGYCNDRTTYYDDGDHTPSATSSIIPTSSYGMTSFGTFIRNSYPGGALTLTCPRGTVDLYTTSSANDGNKQLRYPAAILTADEAALAGSGNTGSGRTSASDLSSNWSDRSYLKGYNDNYSWLLSPYTSRSVSVLMYGAQSVELGNNSQYVRPAISLIHDTYVVSGNGTATKPWIISDEPPDPDAGINLYNAVADQSKSTQSRTDLQTTIDASNSGVYEYNSSVFGSDTDGTKQDNTKATIYYYRGILDDTFTTSTYGSSGDGTLSPNYVILSPTGEKSNSDICWRIIRTTGSGGVKMIYNGKWTGSTCANAQSNARTGTGAYNTASGNNPARRIALAGYTYNSYGTSTSTTNDVSPDNMFGSNNSYSSNSNSSVIKGNVETWYTNNLSSYTTILESNAGFCNDRSVYTNTSGTTAASTLRPSGSTSSSGTTAYFGAYPRHNNTSTTRIPSLACPRNIVDVYSTSTASGGNGQLSYPIALITADELAFAGAGSQTATNGSTYSSNSYIRSGNSFWTMSPSSRTTSNSRATLMYYSNASGYLSNNGQITTTSYDIRPVISLKEGTEATGGTGVAEDPWVVVAP